MRKPKLVISTGAGVSAEKFTAQSLPSAGALMKENDMPVKPIS